MVLACRAKGLKVSTVRGIVRTLSTILSQAVDDELLPANPAMRMGKYLRQADDPEPTIDPFTKDEAAHVIAVARAFSGVAPVGPDRVSAQVDRTLCGGCRAGGLRVEEVAARLLPWSGDSNGPCHAGAA